MEKRMYKPKEANLRKLEAFLKKVPELEKVTIKTIKDKQ